VSALERWLQRLPAFQVGQSNDRLRHDFVRDALSRLPAGTRLLDAGAGERRFQPYCGHLHYVSQDFGQYDGVGDRRGLHTGAWDQSGIDLLCDITNIPQPDGSFGAILCTEVLEHVPAPLEALAEFARLLAPGGTLILTAPFVSFTHFAPYHFHTGFSRYFYHAHLPPLGFEIGQLVQHGNFFELLAQEVWRVREAGPRYAGRRLRLHERAGLLLLLGALARFSRCDRESQEFACYGIGVSAIKRASLEAASESSKST